MHRYKLILACLLLLIMVPAMAAKSSKSSAAPGDIQYKRVGGDVSEMKSFPPSIFPHWVHRIHYRCDACHDSLFEMKLGVTPVTKDLMKAGKVCGACHNGEQAFSAGFENCARCHVSAEK